MNILVTGGAGFIGSHIVDRLIDLGHSVSIIDNLSTGKISFLNQKADFYEYNILDDGIDKVFETVRPEVVIHHAAQIDVQTSLKQPSLDASLNILGTIKLLESCKNHGIRKFIYASSAAVYGTPEYLPVDENHPIQPLSFYGISKHTPEHYIQAFSYLSGIDYTILRYANVYGIRQDPKGEGGVISIFIDKLLGGQTSSIYGDGEQTRDFIYVKDIVEANMAALEHGSKGIYNISNNKQTSINELLKLMSSLCDKSLSPNYLAPRAGDIIHSCLDNKAAIKALGWKPEYDLTTGLKETCEYYMENYLL
jgi:UDP-glucose 4-epimerase